MTTFGAKSIEVKSEVVRFYSNIEDSDFDDGDLSKCGDVFICSRGDFVFSCYFCTLKFTNYEVFTRHIQESHYKLILHDTEKEEILEIVEDSIFKGEYINESLESALEADDVEIKDINEVSESPFETVDVGNQHINEALESSLEIDDVKSKQKNEALESPLETDDVESNNQDSASTEKDKNAVDSTIFYNKVHSDHGKIEYKCGQCNKSFRKKAGLVNHARRHRNTTSSRSFVKPIAPASKIYVETLDVTSKPVFKCDYCEYTNQMKYKLVIHERIHTGEMPYQCEICKKCFRSRAKLTNHLVTHSAKKPHKCTYCPIECAAKNNLNVHIRRVHLNHKPFKCSHCDKRFVTTTEKTQHELIHTGEKRFQCEICGGKFRTSSLLLGHKKTIHETVRRFVCTVCNKKFKTNNCLKNHGAVHSTERPHECKVCGAAFPRRKAMLVHMKLHSDVKQYVCNICQKAFAQHAGLYSHMKSHGIDPSSKSKNNSF